MTLLSTYMTTAIQDTITHVLKIATGTEPNERLPKERLIQSCLFSSLATQLKNNHILVEKNYRPVSGTPSSTQSCDLWFDLPCQDEVWVEVKNSWRSNDTISKTTEMLGKYQQDVEKLQNIAKSPEYKNAVKLFVLFSYTFYDPDEEIESQKNSHRSYLRMLASIDNALGAPIAQEKAYQENFWRHAKVNFISARVWQLPKNKKTIDLMKFFKS